MNTERSDLLEDNCLCGESTYTPRSVRIRKLDYLFQYLLENFGHLVSEQYSILMFFHTAMDEPKLRLAVSLNFSHCIYNTDQSKIFGVKVLNTQDTP